MRDPQPLEEAISRLERAFATQRSVRVIAPLAEAYRLGDRLDEAVATARDGARDHPGSTLRDQGHEAEAREAFREVMRLDPENMEALVFVESTPDPRWDHQLESGGETEPAPAESPGEPVEQPVERVAPLTPLEDQASEAAVPGASEGEAVSLTNELAHLSDLFGPSVPGRGANGELAGIATLTLAEIYARQGLPDKAVEVCQQILARDPEDEEAKRRLTEYQRALAESR